MVRFLMRKMIIVRSRPKSALSYRAYRVTVLFPLYWDPTGHVRSRSGRVLRTSPPGTEAQKFERPASTSRFGVRRNMCPRSFHLSAKGLFPHSKQLHADETIRTERKHCSGLSFVRTPIACVTRFLRLSEVAVVVHTKAQSRGVKNYGSAFKMG